MVSTGTSVLIVFGASTAVFIATYLYFKFKMRGVEKAARKDALKRSRAVIGGQVAEQLSPYFPEFPYQPSEAKFLGSPIDFIVFRGMDEKDIEEVVFVEVKTGSSSLSAQERRLRDAIRDGKVSWYEYRTD